MPFKPINPYLTLYLLKNINSSSTLVNNIKTTLSPKNDIIYKPRNTITVIGNKFPKSNYNIKPKKDKDYILLDYYPNEYNLMLESIMVDMDIKILFNQCYVKLFEIRSNILTPKIYEDMMYSCLKFPNLKLGNIGLLRR